MQGINSKTIEVCRGQWSDTRVVSESLNAELADNAVLLHIDRLALTANNVSYASAGDALGYWRFFPAQQGWGRIPAMGWADVIASSHADISVGERVWGFFPFSTHLKIVAGKVNSLSFSDVAPYRDGLAPVYAQFDRAATYPVYEEAREDQDSLLRGLFMTSWLVEDFLQVNTVFGAVSCLITSASSKTSIALGHAIKTRGKLRSIALTSAKNVAFCRSLGCYDTVLSYDQIATLNAAEPVVMVDMAGSTKLLGELHHLYGVNMRYSCRVGATHQEGFGPLGDLPGATPEFFFAPGHLQTRSKAMEPGEFMLRLGAAYVSFRAFCDGWLRISRSYGVEAVTAIYQQVLAGQANPATGHIISLRPEP